MPAPFDYEVLEISDEQFEEENALYGSLADAVRRLNEVSLRTTVDAEVVTDVRDRLVALTERLETEMIPGNYGIAVTTTGKFRGHGNAVVGLRNPIAVPLQIVQDREAQRARASFTLGPLYEGPPGCVHGGVAAMVLDQVFGEAAAAGGTPGMTGTLTVRYRKPTPLGDLEAEGWVDSRDGYKTVVKGALRTTDGTVTVEAEGLFVTPRWARERIDAAPPQYE